MKKIRVFWQLFFLIILIVDLSFAQTIATPLPMKIGENSTDRNKGNLSGRITIQGLDPSRPAPAIFVSVFFNGVLFDRRQSFKNGTYLVPGIPRENVIVTVEVNGVEFSKQMLMPSIMGNIQQDFTVNLGQGQNNNQKSGVVSAKDLYSRSEENEKIFQKAMSAAKDKKFDQATLIYKQIVDNDPKDFAALTELGTSYFREEKFAEAEKAYQNALDQKPDYMVALLNLGKLFLSQKHLEKAISVLTKAVETDQINVEALHHLGEAYLQNKQGNNTAILFYEALRLAPLEKAELHLRLAWLFNAKGYKDKAVEEYKQFLAKVPNHAEKEKIEKYIRENSPKK